ncbi:MAG TPA: metallophosphoesterase [Acidobacteriota bacterium]|nr:metallophosphoesterase [Acidobacteriota bacterium]
MPAPGDERVSGSPRTRIFIGDVHGCADELHDLLEAIRYDPATQALHFVGDLVNRGPKSLQTLREVIRLGAESVLGNHELHLLARADGRRTQAPMDTLDELLTAPDCGPLLDWVRKRPAVRLWPDLVLVHAGLPAAWTDLAAEVDRIDSIRAATTSVHELPDIDFLVSVRYCDSSGKMVRRIPGPGEPSSGGTGSSLDSASTMATSRPWYELYRGNRTVVFGHWAERRLVNTEHMRGLDTACVWGGRLTAWIAEEDRFVSVAARKQYQKP